VAQAGLDFIRNNVSINSIITGEAQGQAGQRARLPGGASAAQVAKQGQHNQPTNSCDMQTALTACAPMSS